MGWIGSWETLEATLRGMNADRTGQQWHVGGVIVSFLGMGEEYVVADDAVAYVNNEPRPLVPELAKRVGGAFVTVI